MPPPVDSEQTMKQALESRPIPWMAAANWAFIQDRIHEIEARGPLIDRQRMRKMASYCRSRNATEGNSTVPDPATGRHSGGAGRVTVCNGWHPSTATADGQRRTSCIWRPCRISSSGRQRGGPPRMARRRPGRFRDATSVGCFFKYTHAIDDPDFRRAGIAGYPIPLVLYGYKLRFDSIPSFWVRLYLAGPSGCPGPTESSTSRK
ncbi:hypothetical protein BDV26DRAFT_293791 [Aspergillus bertholletiae]|uniref:Uncharacterized protein n=1 Tax=Aspergillus bertholletiae TaxID=1226010 RepID=A0A5N7B5F5_9EURO|nr:hypothetical protein BDV26DRAFT_293791 [Aspergillus bertholletiae]